MDFFRRFMYGRYGSDQLSLVLIVLAILLNLLAVLFKTAVLQVLGTLLLLYCIFRMFSRSVDKRRRENVKFLTFFVPIKSWFGQKFMQIKYSKTHKFFRCPSCKNILRVPKGKGKLHITCPKCGERFEGKT